MPGGQLLRGRGSDGVQGGDLLSGELSASFLPYFYNKLSSSVRESINQLFNQSADKEGNNEQDEVDEGHGNGSANGAGDDAVLGLGHAFFLFFLFDVAVGELLLGASEAVCVHIK